MAAQSKLNWASEWNPTQRAFLWATALGSTVAPDFDVIYNTLFRGFFNHSILWTHSVFVYLVFGLVWLVFNMLKRCTYIKTVAGLVALGGLSHLILDMVAHGTPILYPISMRAFGIAPQRVINGGVLAYLTDPIFLSEPLFCGIAIIHWIHHQDRVSTHFKNLMTAGIIGGIFLFTITFTLLLPILQEAVLPLLPL
ncbi:MAG: metal-dependent hydrolase [Anaerolineae bacterium]|nr:metal-dependent hydrolase [Anaerolineae bacterium]